MVSRLPKNIFAIMIFLGGCLHALTLRGVMYDRVGQPVSQGIVSVVVYCGGVSCDGSGSGAEPYEAQVTLSSTGLFIFDQIPEIATLGYVDLDANFGNLTSNYQVILESGKTNVYNFQVVGFDLILLTTAPRVAEINQSVKTQFSGGNLVLNSSFEDASFLFQGQKPAGWVGRWGGQTERVKGTSSSPSLHGQYHLKVSLGAANAEGEHEGAKYIITEEDPAFRAISSANAEGRGFAFSAWVKATPQAIGKTIVMGNIHTQGDVNAYTFTDQEWHRISHLFPESQIHPNTFAFRYFGFSVHESDNSSDPFAFYLDNVSLVIGSDGESGPPVMSQELVDGEGRTLQAHALSKSPSSPSYSREILRTDFDALARPSKNWLPFAEDCAGSGCWKASMANPNSHYQGGANGLPDAGGFAYSEPLYEQDPLARVFQSTLPGALYQPQHGHLSKISYSATSSLSETALGANRAEPANTSSPIYSYSHQRNENGSESMIWKDQLGNVVKASGYDAEQNAFVASRMVYDDKGKLIRSLPPLSCKAPDGTEIGGANCIDPVEFEYNQAGNLIKETSPDFGEIRYAYNVAGELRAKQSQAQRDRGEFTVYKYDALSRPLETGIYKGQLSEVELPGFFDNAIAGPLEEDNPSKWSFLALENAHDAVADALDGMNRIEPVNIYQVVQQFGEEVAPPPGTEFTAPLNADGHHVELEIAGVLRGGALYQQLIASRNGSGAAHGFGDRSWPYPGDRYEVQVRNVYDNLDNLPSDVRVDGVPYILPAGEDAGFSKGKLVASLSYNPHLSEAGFSQQSRLVANAYKYDKFGNIVSDFKYIGSIHTAAKRIQETEYTYDKANRLLTQIIWKESGGSSCEDMSSFHRFTYDGFGRLDKVFTNKSGDCNQEEQLADYEYFPGGKVKSITIKGAYDHQLVTDYRYHVRGWLASIHARDAHCPLGSPCTESPIFNQELLYDANLTADVAQEQYNGNIAQILYTLGQTSDNREFVYLYDHLQRLKKALYNASGSDIDYLDEEYAYLPDGRFKTLKRGRVVQTVAQPYRYHDRSNKLKCVDDVIDKEISFRIDRTCTGSDGSIARYAYDADGNLVTDGARGYTIAYDWRGLPWKFSGENSQIIMIYDASGQRVSKIEKSINENGQLANVESKHYIGKDKEIREGFDSEQEREINNLIGAGTLGRIRPDGQKEFYVYNHLGSLVTAMSENGEWMDQSLYDYFPYGKKVELAVGSEDKVTEGFTGKELDDGIGLTYFGARYYDADLGMWIGPDPKRQFHSPYSYTGNFYNPINAIDLDGNEITAKYNRSTGRLTLVDSDPSRGSRWVPAVSGHHDDPNQFGGPIPLGDYHLVPTPGKNPDTYFGLFKDDGKIDDVIDAGEGVGRGLLRLHMLTEGSDGCISACRNTMTWEPLPPSFWKEIADWIKGTKTTTYNDSEGKSKTSYGTLTVEE